MIDLDIIVDYIVVTYSSTKSNRECSATGCIQKTISMTYCSKHYQRWRKRGSVEDLPRIRISESNRFWNQVSIGNTNECWTWKGHIRKDGYATFKSQGSMKLVHRWCYAERVGQLLKDMCIDHLCNNRACVNPAHLHQTTIRKNTLRSTTAPAAVNARKTECPRGHSYTPENTLRADSRGARRCRTCNNERRRKSNANMVDRVN